MPPPPAIFAPMPIFDIYDIGAQPLPDTTVFSTPILEAAGRRFFTRLHRRPPAFFCEMTPPHDRYARRQPSFA